MKVPQIFRLRFTVVHVLVSFLLSDKYLLNTFLSALAFVR